MNDSFFLQQTYKALDLKQKSSFLKALKSNAMMQYLYLFNTKITKLKSLFKINIKVTPI